VSTLQFPPEEVAKMRIAVFVKNYPIGRAPTILLMLDLLRKCNHSVRRLIRRIVGHLIRMNFHVALFIGNFALGRNSWRMNRAWIDYFRKRACYDLRLLRDESWPLLVLKKDWLIDS
jgi:hypothetical protein